MPTRRTRTGRVVRSPATSTSIVSPSSTNTTLPVHWAHRGEPACGRQAAACADGARARRAKRVAASRRMPGDPSARPGCGMSPASATGELAPLGARVAGEVPGHDVQGDGGRPLALHPLAHPLGEQNPQRARVPAADPDPRAPDERPPALAEV